MAKDKLRRFAEFRSFTNTFDFAYDLKGKWHSDVFKNNHPITLELGCGKGEYTVALGREYPQRNFIGNDLKSNRMWKGAGMALDEGLTNVAFQRMLMHKITELFAPGEVSEIWITFPDPFPKDRHAKHRLTHPRYLSLYKQVLKENGVIHFKTDDTDLFEFTAAMLPEVGITADITDRDVHHNPDASAHLKNITTHYEKLFMGKGRTIKYLQFTLSGYNEELAARYTEKLEEARKRASTINLPM